LKVTKGPCPTSQPKAEGKEKQVWLSLIITIIFSSFIFFT